MHSCENTFLPEGISSDSFGNPIRVPESRQFLEAGARVFAIPKPFPRAVSGSCSHGIPEDGSSPD